MSGIQCHTCILLMLSRESNMFILVVFVSCICSSLTIVLAGTTEHVVQAALRLHHTSHHACDRRVPSSAMPHRLPCAYAYESPCDEDAHACAFPSSHVSCSWFSCRPMPAGPLLYLAAATNHPRTPHLAGGCGHLQLGAVSALRPFLRPAAPGRASSCRPGPTSSLACAGTGIASSADMHPRGQGSTKRKHGKSKVARQWHSRHQGPCAAAACQQHNQGHPQRHWFVSSIFRVLRHGAS